mmetsp:Transcript_55058/g.91402  ORF Transcript_55058/g.91402 Transcript_55058/m.91402 type:complete len:107 (+) Transcript_55058:289-609(+)
MVVSPASVSLKGLSLLFHAEEALFLNATLLNGFNVFHALVADVADVVEAGVVLCHGRWLFVAVDFGNARTMMKRTFQLNQLKNFVLRCITGRKRYQFALLRHIVSH